MQMCVVFELLYLIKNTGKKRLKHNKLSISLLTFHFFKGPQHISLEVYLLLLFIIYLRIY